MAKSIITQDGDLVNYDNLVSVSVETRSIVYDEDKENIELCIVGVDTSNVEILIFHSPNDDEVMAVQRDIVRWLQSEAFSTFEIPVKDEGGDS